MAKRIDRYKTAIHRDRLSIPMKTLWKLGFFEHNYSALDYGCGHGDDVSILREHHIPINGWDPHFFPDAPVASADIVNLGYVVNVIENVKERRQVIQKAFALAKRVLCIAVMLDGQGQYQNPTPYNDGFITNRNTFQKYYTQNSFKAFVEDCLGIEVVSIAPGVVFAFANQTLEQEFLFEKQHKARAQGNLYSLDKLRNKLKWTEYHELAQDFWAACLHFVRLPTPSEYPRYQEVKEKLGEPKKALAYLLSINDEGVFEQAKQHKREDILVYLALNCFHKRQSFNALPSYLKKDIKSLFGSYKQALSLGEKLLYQIGDKPKIASAIESAESQGLGVSDPSKFVLAQSRLNELPVLLRVYIGCTSILYGEAMDADLICLYRHSAKIALRTYADFSQRIPVLQEAAYVDLYRQRINFVSYEGRATAKRLYLKSRWMVPGEADYEQQVKFDTILRRYVPGEDLHSDFPPEEVIEAMPKSHKRKFEKALGG